MMIDLTLEEMYYLECSQDGNAGIILRQIRELTERIFLNKATTNITDEDKELIHRSLMKMLDELARTSHLNQKIRDKLEQARLGKTREQIIEAKK